MGIIAGSRKHIYVHRCKDNSIECSVGVPTATYAPPLRYKREVLAAHTKRGFWGQAHPDSSNTTLSGRRVLISGSPNHSKPAVFIVFFQEIELVLANPRVLTLWA